MCDLPKGRRDLTIKRIYKRKEGVPRVKAGRWKARLVVRGCKQKEGINFNKVFSPVVRHVSIRVLIAFVALFHYWKSSKQRRNTGMELFNDGLGDGYGDEK